MSNKRQQTKERIPQLDFLKGIFILLMVIFHLALIEETYPLLRNAVYTFHMSAFLIISGYLANIDKRPAEFGHGLLRILIPYVLFEALYILMQYFLGGSLGAHNAIGQLTTGDFIMRIATQPTGPYWYLHTLIICIVVYWLIYRLLRVDGLGGLALIGLILYGLSLIIEGLNWSNIIYFIIGVFIMRLGKNFMDVISPSWLSFLPLIALFYFPENYNSGTLAGLTITVLVISVLLALYPLCLNSIKSFFTYIGRNSLAIVLFSPIFTIITKQFSPWFDFDPTALCFLIVSLTFVVGGCLASAWLSDKLTLSQFVFLKKNFYSQYKHEDSHH